MSRPCVPKEIANDSNLTSAFGSIVAYYESRLLAKNKEIVALECTLNRIKVKLAGTVVLSVFVGYVLGKIL